MRIAILCIAMGGLVAVAGCERTISERDTTSTRSNGTVVKTSEKVKEAPDGTVKVEKEREVNP